MISSTGFIYKKKRSFALQKKRKLTLLKPILYFSLFKYPLTEEEIYAFSDASSREHLKDSLDDLVRKKVIYKIDQFYLLENDKNLITRRLKGNKMAAEIQKKAANRARFISRFPYVEGVGISGSLSKGYFDDDGDIDFFIITKAKRLWIARTLLVLYKKIFLLNSRKYFCVNYFISESALEIDEKNRFTATELATLMPMFGNGSFHRFYQENDWVKEMLPNKTPKQSLANLLPLQKPLITRVSEKIFNTKFGDSLDSFFMRITYKKWKVKFLDSDPDRFNIAFKSTQNISKHHPNDFQKKVINGLNEKYLEVQENHNITLSLEHA